MHRMHRSQENYPTMNSTSTCSSRSYGTSVAYSHGTCTYLQLYRVRTVCAAPACNLSTDGIVLYMYTHAVGTLDWSQKVEKVIHVRYPGTGSQTFGGCGAVRVHEDVSTELGSSP
eukprot:COSAG02_NODE_163_length_32424_cov_21.759010_15_plen_115_part_00